MQPRGHGKSRHITTPNTIANKLCLKVSEGVQRSEQVHGKGL